MFWSDAPRPALAHYLVNLSATRVKSAVAAGVRFGRRWCRERGIALVQSPELPATRYASLHFRERMSGFISFGADDFRRAAENGRRSGTEVSIKLHMHIDDVDRFITEPDHEGRNWGVITCDALGGHLDTEGTFNLLVDEGDPEDQRMLYRLFFRDSTGRPLTLSAVKYVKDDPGADMWNDTTDFFTRILRGHVNSEGEKAAEVVATGTMRFSLWAFLRQMTTFRAQGPTAREGAAALVRFKSFFLGRLWDVYARCATGFTPF